LDLIHDVFSSAEFLFLCGEGGGGWVLLRGLWGELLAIEDGLFGAG
jgi:hypothetical protein